MIVANERSRSPAEQQTSYQFVRSRIISLERMDPTESFTAFGFNTLYEITRLQPDSLVKHAKIWHEEWTLLVQVFRVLRTAALMNIHTSLDRITDQCEHESPAVRAAAIRALADSGWRAELRSRVPVELLTNDSSPPFRTAIYRTLGAWRVPDACKKLSRAVREERNPRCRLSAVRAVSHNQCHERLESDFQYEFPRLWDWVAATQQPHKSP